MSGDQDKAQAQERETVAAEKFTLGLSILILLAVVALVIYQAVSGGSQPATFAVEPQFPDLRQAGDLYYLPVEVTNEGDQTAEDVTVSFTLRTLGGDGESSSFVIRFLEGGATARGVVVFGSRPSAGELRYTLSYLRP